MIKTLDKSNLVQIREDINAALKAVGTKHGLVLDAGNASYSPTNATFKLAVSVITDGVVMDKPTADFKRFCTMYGFKPENLGAKFTSRGVEFTLTGLDSKSHKYPMLARSSKDGKDYKMTREAVQRALGIPVPLRDFGADVFKERA
jgi:hypothetical protein